MCDEFTAVEEERALTLEGVTRREFAALGAVAALAGCAGTAGGAASRALPPLTEQMVTFATPDGTAEGFFVHPAKGKHPGVVFWPDIAGVRDASKAMGRRLAQSGFAVLVVNQYYRSARAPVVNTLSEWRLPENQARLGPMRALLTTDAINRDAAAYVGFLDAQKVVDKKRGIGTQGYCMGGPFAVRTAAAVPDRVRAAASFHGGGLVTDKPDSPHLLLPRTQASYLVAIARNDDARAPKEKEALLKAATLAGRPAEIEVYPAEHGWCALDAPVYDRAQAERAWTRLLALYAKL